MSRSFKRNPIIGHTFAESEKYDKRLANRSLRRKTRAVLNTSGHGRAGVVVEGVSELPLLREVSNVYSFDKDGKQWLDSPDPEDLRK
ncbi:MAG: hypothetical protein JSS83_24530 [Cyanobacteria bacterium SZAS LIN-3]|nr:hypothetical protein [Cyanobacteria bacterium SZAS LIN-3]